MKLNRLDRVVIALATLFLGIIAVRPFLAPQQALAASPNTTHFYVEPGIHTLVAPDRSESVQGKVMIDMNTGNVWGFPTAPEVPYPIEVLKQEPATSSPIYLGKFDLSVITSISTREPPYWIPESTEGQLSAVAMPSHSVPQFS